MNFDEQSQFVGIAIEIVTSKANLAGLSLYFRINKRGCGTGETTVNLSVKCFIWSVK
jgi:hypothetical protein